MAAVDVLPLGHFRICSEDDSFGGNIENEDGTRSVWIPLLLGLKVLHGQWRKHTKCNFVQSLSIIRIRRPNNLGLRVALQSNELFSVDRPVLKPLANSTPVRGAQEQVVLNKTDPIDPIAVFAQHGGRTARVVAVTVRRQERRQSLNAHALQELQWKATVTRAAVDNYGRSIPDQDDLACALGHVEKEDFHAESPLRTPLTVRL
jgi:hypothetical protein